jgi:hypothetical protein
MNAKHGLFCIQFCLDGFGFEQFGQPRGGDFQRIGLEDIEGIRLEASRFGEDPPSRSPAASVRRAIGVLKKRTVVIGGLSGRSGRSGSFSRQP